MKANAPLQTNTDIAYFEVEILACDADTKLAIGLVQSQFLLQSFPGTQSDSFGYCSDGQIWSNGSKESKQIVFKAGSVVGCGIAYVTNRLFFTVDGIHVRTIENVKMHLYPAVGLHGRGQVVRINFGEAPFKFNIEALRRELKELQARSIDNVKLPDASRLIYNYLLFNGYHTTAEAYAKHLIRSHHVESCRQSSRDSISPSNTKNGDKDSSGAGMDMDTRPIDASKSSSPSGAKSDQSSSSSTISTLKKIITLTDFDIALHKSLEIRAEYRKMVMAGLLDEVIIRLTKEFPHLLKIPQLEFALESQKYIEAIRSKNLDKAMQIVQDVFGLHWNQDTEATIQDCCALLCYFQPETSPVAYLMSTSHLEKTADLLNIALHQSISAQHNISSIAQRRTRSDIQFLLAHLMVNMSLLREKRNAGEAFDLGRFIGEPFPLPDVVSPPPSLTSSIIAPKASKNSSK